ncbi:MAG TPA: adenylyltransferase/cytidyltransferase family protein, partial [Gemmatimonadaceae bacterium]|nr:adenylyltransferase/cytidyltransferase family protein [Gemmatimonadaceae bacterium]
MSRTAVYAGSFDPITAGHRDLIFRSLRFVDRLVVAIAVNVNKQPL